jgi:asparagine synthase (glutamine-hydrolysing)
MSAIVGIYRFDQLPVECSSVRQMVDTLVHRGPDGSEVWCNGPVGLGHRMLWSTPESLLERLPLIKGDLAITADARIDNREELISLLELNDRPAEKITDSDIILAAYEKWEERCPEKLLGDFAFAIWDGRRRKIFCARDHFGVKPFYYYVSKSVFIFATEIKALLSQPEVPNQINELKVGEFLTATAAQNTATTFFEEILRLCPAHCLVIGEAEINLKSYWALDPSYALPLSSDTEYANKFREIFIEAVRCRLRSAFPVGSMLSGGLDSSSIACVAKQLSSNGSLLPTFSGVFDTVTECDESFFQNTVLAQGGFDPYYLHADQISPLTDLEKVLWHQDECFTMDNSYIIWCTNRIAQGQGIRILLSGYDGDNTVSHGNAYFRELASKRRWITLRREMKAYGERMDIPWSPTFWLYVRRFGIKPATSNIWILKAASNIWILKKVRNTCRTLVRVLRKPKNNYEHSVEDSILNPEFAQKLKSEPSYRIEKEQPYDQRYDHYRSLTNSLLAESLEMMDRMSGAFSIENRFPFWDKRLVEFCLALPPEQKLRQGWSRMILRQSMAGILPQEVQWRTGKANLQPNYEHGLLNFEHERLKEIILNHPEKIEKYVNTNVLREAFNRFSTDCSTDKDLICIMQVVSFASWLQNHQFDEEKHEVLHGKTV